MLGRNKSKIWCLIVLLAFTLVSCATTESVEVFPMLPELVDTRIYIDEMVTPNTLYDIANNSLVLEKMWTVEYSNGLLLKMYIADIMGMNEEKNKLEEEHRSFLSIYT